MRLRLLPLLILTLIGFLLLHGGQIFSAHGQNPILAWFSTKDATAKDEQDEKPAKEEKKEAEHTEKKTENGGEHGKEPKESKEELEKKQAELDALKCQQQTNVMKNFPSRPGDWSDAEVEVLEQLSKRRQDLDAREQEFLLKEKMLQALELRVNDRIKEIKGLEQSVSSLMRSYKVKEDERLIKLVKIYENMKPKNAASIFEQTRISVILDVVEKMKEPIVAEILAKMDPEKANIITMELRERKKLKMTTTSPSETTPPSTESQAAQP